MAGKGGLRREGESSRLESALTERVRLVLVVGDAGIGKTRFVAKGLRRASASGMVAVGGGCLPLAVRPPLLPVTDALAALSRLDGGAPFEAALSAAPPYVRAELARLLPRLATGENIAAEPVEAWAISACSRGWPSCSTGLRGGLRWCCWSRTCAGRTPRRRAGTGPTDGEPNGVVAGSSPCLSSASPQFSGDALPQKI